MYGVGPIVADRPEGGDIAPISVETGVSGVVGRSSESVGDATGSGDDLPVVVHPSFLILRYIIGIRQESSPKSFLRAEFRFSLAIRASSPPMIPGRNGEDTGPILPRHGRDPALY